MCNTKNRQHGQYRNEIMNENFIRSDLIKCFRKCTFLSLFVDRPVENEMKNVRGVGRLRNEELLISRNFIIIY